MNPDFQTIRKLIERRYRRRIVFGLHLTIFTCVVGVTAWWMLTHQVYQADLKNLWYLVGWTVILFLHWLIYTLINMRDREIESAWERVYGKSSSDTVVSELTDRPIPNRLWLAETESFEDDWAAEKPKRTLPEK